MTVIMGVSGITAPLPPSRHELTVGKHCSYCSSSMVMTHAHPECMHVRSATRGSRGQHPSRRVSLSEEIQEAGLAAYPEPWFALGKGERIRRLTMAVRPVSVVHDGVSEGLNWKVSTEYGARCEDSAPTLFFPYRLFFFFSPCLSGAIINEIQEIWIQKVGHIIISMGVHGLIRLPTVLPRNQNTTNFSFQKQLKSRD